MKRSRFVVLSTVGALSLYLPAISCRNQNTTLHKVLAQPQLLLHICDAKTIREIGQTYLQQNPEEANEEQLVNLLLTGNFDKNNSESSDSTTLNTLLNKKIQQDFE